MSGGGPTPCLKGLPVEVQEKIVDMTDVLDRIRLRRVSSDFMYMCDYSETHYESLMINYDDAHITVELRSPTLRNFVEIFYLETEDGCQVAQGPGYKNHDEYHQDIAVRDIIGILRNPRITIGTLEINDPTQLNKKRREFMLKLGREIVKFNHQISVKHLITNGDLSEDELLCIWPFIKPRYLENIDLWWRCLPPQTTDLIVESAQWRHAKRLNLRGAVPLDKLRHFQKCITNGQLTAEELDGVMDNILANLETFEEFKMNLNTMKQNDNTLLDYIVRYPDVVVQRHEKPTKLVRTLENGVTIKLTLFKHKYDSFIRIWKDIPYMPCK